MVVTQDAGASGIKARQNETKRVGGYDSREELGDLCVRADSDGPIPADLP
jgi:hypothetical protein